MGGGVLGEQEEDSVMERWMLAGHYWGRETTVLREKNKYRWV